MAAVKQLATEYYQSDELATASMCSEHDSRSCHRKLVSQRLYDDFNVNVTHIRFDGTVFKHEKETKPQLTDEAFLTTITEPMNTWHEKSGIFVCDYGSTASNEVAGFDLDGTIIKTKSGKQIPVGREDWEFWSDEVAERITTLHDEGKKIVIISNQGGVNIGRAKLVDLQEKVNDIQKQINIPMLVMIITEKGHNRKPDVGSWEILEEHFNNKIPIL